MSAGQAVEKLSSCIPGIDKETRGVEGGTRLFIAAHNGNREIVDLLLKAQVDVNGPSKGGFTPLMTVARHGHEDIVRLLLDNNANCQTSSESGFSSLHYATHSQSGGSLIRLFKGKVPDFNITQHRNLETPFITLIKNFANTPAWKEKFFAILEAGVNVNLADANEMTPLAHAANQDQPDLARALINWGAQYGNTPFPPNMSTRMSRALRGIRPCRRFSFH